MLSSILFNQQAVKFISPEFYIRAEADIQIERKDDDCRSSKSERLEMKNGDLISKWYAEAEFPN